MSFDILTYALLRKQIAQGGIQNIEFQNGNLIFTLSDGSTHAVPLPTNGTTYDPDHNTITFQDGTTLYLAAPRADSENATLSFQKPDGGTETIFLAAPTVSEDGTTLSFQNPEGTTYSFFLPNLQTNETGSTLSFQDATGTPKSLPISNLKANEDGTTLSFYDAATGLPRTIQLNGTPSESFFSIQDGKLCVTYETKMANYV